MIYSGYLKPNETLNLQTLAKNFETSVTPINSAISLLAQEGLVVKHPNKSSVVAPLSTEEIKDIWLQGALLEGMASYLATSQITSKEISSMENIMRRTKELTVPDDILRVKELNQEFHGTFLRACQNKKLLKMIRESSWKRYRYYILLGSVQGNHSDFIRHHDLIIKNLKKKDPKGTRDAVESHIISAGDRVIKCIEIGLF